MVFRAYQYHGLKEAIPLESLTCEKPGIFETFRIYYGVIFRLEEHLDRLKESAKTSGFQLPRLEIIKGFLKQVLTQEKRQNGLIRLSIFPPDQMVLFIGERNYAQELYQTGISLRTSPVRRTLSQATFPEAKTSDYQNAVLASLEPRSAETYEWLFLDRDGYVTEVRIGNIFLIRVGTGKQPELITPPEPGILNGVTRRFVIECAIAIGLPVRETLMTRHDLYNANEAFLTNTSWEILPLRQLDGRGIGKQIPGPWTEKLQQQFRKRVEKECRKIKKSSGH